MPHQSQREKLLAAARAQVADWQPVLDGQVDIFEMLEDEGSLEEVSKSSSCLQRKDRQEERHAD